MEEKRAKSKAAAQYQRAKEKIKPHLRFKRSFKLLNEIAPGCLSWYERYSKKLKEEIEVFKLYDVNRNKYININGVAKVKVHEVLGCTQISVRNWLNRYLFVEPMCISVKGTPFYIEDEIRNVIRFFANHQYRRLPSKMTEEQMNELHECFLMARREFLKNKEK